MLIHPEFSSTLLCNFHICLMCKENKNTTMQDQQVFGQRYLL